MIFNPKDVANKILNEIKSELLNRDEKDKPTLAVIRIGENVGAKSYEKSIKSLLEPLNIKIESLIYNEEITQDDLLKEIDKLNKNNKVSGILILHPLPNHIDLDLISSSISPEKDIDASNPINLGKLLINDNTGFIPCTAEAVIELLNFYNINIKGQDIVIINNSDIIGKPLSILLTNKFATVTICHVLTKDISKYTKNADIIISAAGVYGLIKPEILNENSTLIDLAITQEKDNQGNLKINNEGKPIRSGDSLESCKDKVANIISATPGCGGGTGPITTALLAKNVIKAFKLNKGDLFDSNKK